MMRPSNPTSLSAVIPQGDGVVREGNPNTALLRQLLMPMVLAAFAVYLLWGVVTMRVPEGVVFPGPRFFPLIIMSGLFVCALLLAAAAVRERAATLRALQSESAVTGTEIGDTEGSAPMDWRSLAWIVGSFIGFALTLKFLGWIIAAALLFWCISRAFGAQRPLFNVLVGLTASSIAYILFDMALGLPLPSGILGGGF